MKIKNWIACVQDRGKWKEVIEKAKTFNQEVQRLEEEEEVSSSFFVASNRTMISEQQIGKGVRSRAHGQILGSVLALTYWNWK